MAFITTFVPGSESIEMLRRTLVSIVRADYPHDTWLLDEGDDPAARQLCAQLGVRHFSRKGIEAFNRDKGIFLAKSKGGNHNAWYVSAGRDYDVVAQVDSDRPAPPPFEVHHHGVVPPREFDQGALLPREFGHGALLPSAATTSGAAMSVRYVRVYRGVPS